MVLPPDEDDADLLLLDGDDVTVLVEDELLVTDLPLDGDDVVLLVDLLLDTDLVGLLVTDLLLFEDGLTDLPVDLDSEDTLLLLDTDRLPLDEDDVSTLLPVDLDSEDTFLSDTDLLGDDVSTLLLLTVLSGVEPFLLSVPFTCRLGVYVSTFLGLGFE